MEILITGASGFLGTRITEIALERGHRARVFVRRPESAPHGVEHGMVFTGDMTKPASMPPAVKEVDAIIHCAATTSEGAPNLDLSRRVNVEGTRSLIAAAREHGRPRWLQISSMSAHPGSTSVYGRTKYETDQVVRSSDLPWTLLRPGLIYGSGNRGLVAKTVALMRKLPVIPVVGSGRRMIRPVHVDDVARAALECLTAPQTIGKSYMLGGADELEFNEFLRMLGAAHGLRKPLLHLPIPLAMLIAKTLALVTSKPPITEDNVRGVKEAVPLEIEDAVRDFGFTSRSFAEGLKDITASQS